jgi:hypothetical protein
MASALRCGPEARLRQIVMGEGIGRPGGGSPIGGSAGGSGGSSIGVVGGVDGSPGTGAL